MRSIVVLGVLFVLLVITCDFVVVAKLRLAKAPRTSFLSQWTLNSRAQPQELIDFTIALRQRNENQLEDLFWSVSDPDSSKYKEYLTLNDLSEKFGQNKSNIVSIVSWIKNQLISWQTNPTISVDIYIPPTNNAIIIRRAPVAFVEQLFEIKGQLYSFTSLKHQKYITRCIHDCDLIIPDEFLDYIHYIDGINDFPPSRSNLFNLQSSKPNKPVQPLDYPGIPVGPQEIFRQYNIPSKPSKLCNNTMQAVAEFSGSVGQYFNPSDLSTFQKYFNLTVQPVSKIYGKNDPTRPAGEATLDIQYIMAVAQGVPTWFWSEHGTFLDYLLHIQSVPDAPLVHSISYSIGEEDVLDPDYMSLLNNHFKMIALTGKTLIWASGDDGTGSTGIFSCGTFSPGYPATSPYVTSVGATYIDSSLTEKAVSFSGGGFSTLFDRPDYQKSFVEHYLSSMKTTLPPAQYWNSTTRAFPDLAVVGTNYMMMVGLPKPLPISGTSASTPSFSAMLTMINNGLFDLGKRPLGFINPAIYKAPATVWNPITEGSNPCWPCTQGFFAAAPWSPITGLGTPKFPNLYNYLLSI